MSDFFDPFDAPKGNESAQFFDPFDAPAAPAPAAKKQNKGILSDIGGAFVGGAKSAGQAVAATGNVYTGNEQALIDKAKSEKLAQEDKPEALRRFNEAVQANAKPLGEDPGLWDSIKAVGGAVLEQPKGAGLAIVEQLPNSAPAMAGGLAGMKAGAMAGTAVAPGVGTTIGGILGGVAGMFLGNTAIETGHKAIEAAHDGSVTPDEMAKVRREGAAKAGVITGVDALTLGLSKGITNAGARAVESATRKTLADAGVNVADKAALLAARQSPEISSAVRAAQETALASANTLGKRAAAGGAALGLETVGEGVGEYFGELAATGKANMVDAVLESVLSLGQSSAEVAWGAARNKKGEGAGLWDIAGGKYAETKSAEIAGLLPAPTYTGTPGEQIIANDAERQAAIDAADRNAAELYAARDEFEQKLRRAVTITNEPAPLQERIDEMLRVDTSKLSGIARTNYEKALEAAFNEPIGIRHDKDQREVPFTIGEYLDAQVALEDAVRNREKSGRAVAESGTRLQQLAEEEATQQPDIPAPIRGIMPAIQVVGPLSKAANAAVQAGITPVQPVSAGILAPAPAAQPAASPLTAAATLAVTPAAATPSAAVPSVQTATAPLAEASNPATPLPESGAPGAEVQQQAQPVVPAAPEKTAPAAKSNPPAVPAQTEQTAPASASTVAQPLAGSADDTYRRLIEALIKNKRNAKQLGFDIDGAIQKAKDAMHGKKQMPGAFRKLADKAAKLGDTETASILRQIADMNDARKSPKKADPVADQNPIKSEAPAVTEPVAEKAPVDQQAAEEKQSATNPDGKEGADLSWAEVLDEAWNNGFETGNADFVPQKQHLEQAYQRTFTDAQVEEYTATYQRGARESDEKASPPEGSKESASVEVALDSPFANSEQQNNPAETDAEARFSKNTIFTADKVAAARARLKSKLGTMNSGIDPELLVDGMTIAGAYIESGVRKFGDYAKAMVADLGDGVKPYLLSFYEAARAYPGLNKMGMDSQESAAKQHQAMLTPEVKAAANDVVGQSPKVEKKAPANLSESARLKADYGVKNIDGYTRSKSGKNQETDYGLKGGIKDEFLADAKRYLKAVSKLLEDRGFETHVDNRGKGIAAVNSNEAGPAVSGDVYLAMRRGDFGVYAQIGVSSIRGIGPGHPQGVSLMVRVTPQSKNDRSATKGTNNWLDPMTSAGELVAWFDKQRQANEQRSNELSYEQFKEEMQRLLTASHEYSPNQVGFGDYAEKMAALSDKYPDYSRRLDAESDSVGAVDIPAASAKLEETAPAAPAIGEGNGTATGQQGNSALAVAATPEEAKAAEPVAPVGAVVAPEWADKVAQKQGYTVVGQSRAGFALFEKDGNRILQETPRKAPKPASNNDRITVPWSESLEWDSAYSTPDELARRYVKLLEYATFKVGDKAILTNFGGKQTVGTVESVKANASVTSVIALNANGGLGLSRGTLNPNITYTLIAEDGKRVDYASQEMMQAYDPAKLTKAPEAAPAASKANETGAVPAGISIGQFKHTKTGVPQYSVAFKERVERDVFDRAKQIAGGYGVRYSAFRGHGAIPGFLFMNEAKANEFAQEIGKLVAPPESNTPTTPEPDAAPAVDRQPNEYTGKASALFAALDDNARTGVQFGMFPAALMEQARREGYTDNQALTTHLMAEWRKAQQKPAKIEMPNESATLETKETLNANAKPAQTGNDGQRVPASRTPGTVSSAAGEQGTGRRGDESGRGSAGDVQRPDGNVDGRRASDESGREGESVSRDGAIPDDAGEPNRRIGAGANARISERNSSGRNYLAPIGALERKGSWLETAKRNVEIIKLVKRLGDENRLATAEEQAKIAQYVGFGASELANGLFPPEYEYVRTGGRGYGSKRVPTGNVDESALKPGWKEVYFDLKNSVTADDLKAIMASTQFAHFTSEKVIRSIWKSVERFGFAGGKILEPGMGTGLFMVAAPEQVAGSSRYVGVERDNVTAAIATQLLQGYSVIRNSYIDQNLPDNNFDMAIGNPPFAGWKVMADPRYRKYGFLLHDYFFAKTIDKVRPGGVLVFVTSKGTMDKMDDKARAYLAERADLLGAIRLPQTAFKGNAGTEVVTDVLFLKKRDPGAAPSSTAWTGLKEVQTPQGPTQVNEYFADHPDMVLGRHALVGSMYRANEYTVTPLEGDIEDHFAKATERLPENVYRKAEPVKHGQAAALQQKSDRQEFDVSGKKEGGLYLAEDGELMQVENGVGVPLTNSLALSDKERAWLNDYVPLRDRLKQAMKDQLEDGPWESSLADLKKAYAGFRKKHGRILEHTITEREFANEAGDVEVRKYKRFKWNRLLKSSVDVEISLVQAMEAISEDDNEVRDGGILVNGRVLSKRSAPEIKTVNDAFAVTLNTLGHLDVAHLAGLLNISEAEALAQLGDLVFEHPVEGWQTADEYLSGNVLRKLEEAEVAAATDPRFQRNVQALIAVQPAPLGPDRIVIRLGANWIPANVVQEFTAEALDEPTDVVYDQRTNRWTVEGENLRRNRSAGAEWGTADRSMPEILSSVLNNESITIRRTTEDKKSYVDKDATAKANDVAEKMRQRFANWVWTEAERTENLLAIYNRKFNNLAPRAFDGKHLTLPGLSLRYKLYDHQLRAIWRIIQTGNTYLDHAVGAGKTLEMIVSAMEQKRLGLISKPMFVVPNHMLEQFANEFQEAYPAARILVADKENFIGDQRRRFVAKAALNDWDAIIIKQSSFGLIGIKQDTADAVADDMLDELQSALDDIEKDDRTTRKKLEAQIEQVKQRVDSMVGKGDGNVSFEDLGVDFLYVDEAHTYRKLDYATNRQIKGIDPNGSKGAFGMFAKMRYLHQQRPGRSAVMASGTPVTNTIAELYTVQRFMDYEGLREDGIHAFDAWANNFGAVGQEWERNAAGEYEKVERFSKFVNVPELMLRVRRFMDVLTMEQLGDYVVRPELKGGQPQMITAQKSDALERYMREVLLPRLEAAKAWKPTKDELYNPDPVIAIGTDGRLAAIDVRFAYPTMKDDPGSKLNLMISNIISEYKATANNVYTTDGKADKLKGGTQIVFSSVGFGANVEQNRGFSPRKWMLERLKKAGIASSEVAFMSDYTTDKQKETMFKEMREGKKRILVGSPANMGTGVNVQKRLTTLHFMAPPWYPSDVEQPHGRILRQGNQNKEIGIKWYVTEGTYDSTMWGMVRRKGAAIEQAFRGDGSRTVEDISEVSSYAMAEAVAAGDDRVIKLAEAQANVEKYTRLKNAHFTEQRTLRGNVSFAESEARSLRADILKLDAAVAAQEAAGYSYWKDLPVTVGGQTLTKPSEVGGKLGESIAGVFEEGRSNEVGKVMDAFSLQAVFSPGAKNHSKKDEVEILLHVDQVTFRVADSATLAEWSQADETGLGQRVRNAMKRVDERKRESERRLEEVEGTLTKQRKLVGAPFADESLLAQAIADAAQLQAELVGESIKKQEALKAKKAAANKQSAAEDANEGEEGVGSRANRKDSISPSDKAVYGMAAEGKSSSEILKFIASASRNPFYRQLAKLLLKTGIAPKIMVGDSKGWKMNAGEGHKYAAAYNPKTDTVALFRPSAAERNMLHELVHAATIKALEKGGLSAAQMRALYQHVKKTGKLHGMYGMTDVDEFVSEAFTNPKFQEALKKVMAPQAGGKLSSAWQWFVRVVRGILGLPANDESALSAALEIGLGVMREDMQIRRGESGVPFSEITGREIERTLGRTLQEKATNWMRLNLQGKSFENDATGWDIAVGRKGINKAMSHGARDVHARSVAAIPDLLKHAILVASEENRDAIERESVPRVHHFYAPLRINGAEYIARMVVKEAKDGTRFYDYDTSDEISPAVPGATLPFSQRRGAAPSARLEMSMANLLSHVKAEHGGTDPRFKIRHNVAEFFRGMGIEAGASGKMIESIRSDVQFVAGRDEKTGFPTWKGAHVSLSSPRDVTESHDVFYRPIGGERAVKYDIRSANGQIVGHTVLEIDGDWPTMLLDIEVQKQHRGNRYAEKAVAGIVADAGEIGIWHIVPSARSWWERIGTQTVDAHNGTLAFNDYADARSGREDAQSLGEDVGIRYNIANEAHNESYDLPEERIGNRSLYGAELETLRRAAARLEDAERGVTFRVTEDGQAVVTGPARFNIPDRFKRFAEKHGLTFKAERGSARLRPDGTPERTRIGAMPENYRVSGALYAQEVGSNYDRTDRTRFNVADDGWSVSEPSKMDDVIYALQDKHIDTKRVVQAIIGAGKKIRDAFNPYLQEELFHGRAAKGVKDFLDFELRPLLKDMQSAGVEMGDFEEYLWNRHAEERNRQVAKVNPDMKDGGSGIKTADARAYLAGLSAEQRQNFEALAAHIDQINAGSRHILIESGLEKAETIAAWEGAYKHYVPLQREDVESGHIGTGKGFSVRGSSTKRAMGSGRAVVDIIANLTMQRERNIVRAEKNRVSNALLGLAVQNPNPEFWQVDQAPKERVVEEKAIYTVKDAEGNETEFTRMADAEKFARSLPDADIEQTWGDRVTERVIPGFSTRDNVILTRINGQDHYVVFNERDERAMRMAQSLKNLDTDNLGRVLSTVGKATRYLASINTQYNPVFGVINLIRDAQGSLLNLSSTPLAGEQKRVLGYTVDALRGIYADIRAHRAGKVPSSNWAKLFEEFQREGGQTGYRDQYANAEDRAEAVRSELAQFKEGKAKQMVRGLFGWLSDYNETMENAVRLAAYKAATEKGMSKQQAASLAKNITVNFNRKGQMATQVGALYAFFNASVQGTARIAETLFEKNEGNIKAAKLSKTGKKIIAGGVMLGSMQALLLAAAGFDDDEPPEFVRERNLVMPIGDGKYLTLAMPLGFHVLPGIGRVATEFVLSGGKDPAKKAASFVSMFAEAFNPVGNSGFSLQTITPSVVDPFAALAENKDFTGKEIYRKDFNSLNPQPGHARAKDVSTVWSRYISEALNYITGGSEFRPGLVSVSPDALDYLVGQATGGVGREVSKAFQSSRAVTTGEDLPLYKVPLVGRFVGDTEGQSGQSQKFYDAVRTLNGHENEIKGLLKQGRREEATAYRAENPESSLIMAGNHAETIIRKLRAQKRELIAKEADKEQVRAIDERISTTMKRFNERYRAVAM